MEKLIKKSSFIYCIVRINRLFNFKSVVAQNCKARKKGLNFEQKKFIKKTMIISFIYQKPNFLVNRLSFLQISQKKLECAKLARNPMWRNQQVKVSRDHSDASAKKPISFSPQQTASANIFSRSSTGYHAFRRGSRVGPARRALTHSHIPHTHIRDNLISASANSQHSQEGIARRSEKKCACVAFEE